MPGTVLVGQYNRLSSTFDTTAKTIKIANCTAFDLTAADLVYVYSTTAAKEIPVNNGVSVTCTRAWVSGSPVFTFTLSGLPSGVANGDTLLIYLQVPTEFINYLVLSKISA